MTRVTRYGTAGRLPADTWPRLDLTVRLSRLSGLSLTTVLLLQSQWGSPSYFSLTSATTAALDVKKKKKNNRN